MSLAFSRKPKDGVLKLTNLGLAVSLLLTYMALKNKNTMGFSRKDELISLFEEWKSLKCKSEWGLCQNTETHMNEAEGKGPGQTMKSEEEEEAGWTQVPHTERGSRSKPINH